MNCRMSEVLRNSLPGLLHLSTEAGWDQIALDGRVVAGIDLDIHMMVSPPYPDDLAGSERLLKGPKNAGYVVISIDPAGLQLGDARINQQGIGLSAVVMALHSRALAVLTTTGREDGGEIALPSGPFDPARDRAMLCGSMAMIKEAGELLETYGLKEGSNAEPADYVLERAFVG